MSITVNNKIIETDNEGFLLNPNDWDDKVAMELIAQHEADGNKQVTEAVGRLIRYFREYYQNHMMHPSMKRLLADHAKIEGENFKDEESYQAFLNDLFPNGPVPILSKLAGLPRPAHELKI